MAGTRSLGYRIAQVLGWGMLASVAGLVVLIAMSSRDKCIDQSDVVDGQSFFPAPPCMFVDDEIYEATLETELGDIEVVLDSTIAPTAVNTFVFLARAGWYDGTLFHRIERTDEHAYAQAGAANDNGTGHAGFLVDPEDPSPILQYGTGTVAAVTSGDPPMMGSQFFIVGDDWEAIGPPNAYPQYPPIGRIFDLTSLGVVERLMSAGSADGRPVAPVRILRVTVRVVGDPGATPSSPPASPSPDPSPSPSAHHGG